VTDSSSPHPIEIQWNTDIPSWGQYDILISGPGFNADTPENGSGLQFTYLPPGTKGTWTLTLLQNDTTGTTFTHPDMLAVARLPISSQHTPGIPPRDIARRLGFPT
jgi:hypothetical protein